MKSIKIIVLLLGLFMLLSCVSCGTNDYPKDTGEIILHNQYTMIN